MFSSKTKKRTGRRLTIEMLLWFTFDSRGTGKGKSLDLFRGLDELTVWKVPIRHLTWTTSYKILAGDTILISDHVEPRASELVSFSYVPSTYPSS